MGIVYPCKNTRQCYWLCRDCLKGHAHRCSPKCPDYLSIAKVKKQSKEPALRGIEGVTMPRKEVNYAYQVERGQGE